MKVWCLKILKLYKIINCCSIFDIIIFYYWYLIGVKWIFVLYIMIFLLRVIIMIICRLIRFFISSFYIVFILVCFLNIKKIRMKLWFIFFFSIVKLYIVNMVGICYEYFSILNDVFDFLNFIIFIVYRDYEL